MPRRTEFRRMPTRVSQASASPEHKGTVSFILANASATHHYTCTCHQPHPSLRQPRLPELRPRVLLLDCHTGAIPFGGCLNSGVGVSACQRSRIIVSLAFCGKHHEDVGKCQSALGMMMLSFAPTRSSSSGDMASSDPLVSLLSCSSSSLGPFRTLPRR